MLWLFAILVFGSSAVISRSIARRAREPKRSLPPPVSDERTLLTLQIGDIVQHLDRDYLVDGALLVSEDPRASRLARLVDGALTRYVWATTESEDAWLLERTDPPDGLPNELTRPFPLRLEKRWQGSTIKIGRLNLGIAGDVKVYEYVGGDRLLLVLDAGSSVVALVGTRLLPHAVDILPGRGK